MKQILVYFGLFTLFAGSMGSARYLDAYSSQYQNCAAKWKETVKAAKGEPFIARDVLQNLEQNRMTLAGKACPVLRPDHINLLKNDLEHSLPPKLRGPADLSP